MTRALEDGQYDTGIARAVEILQAAGVETCESCEGGPGHPFPEPTVVFFGGPGEGLRALGVALVHGLPVQALDRVWRVDRGEPNGPLWQLRFWPDEVTGAPPEEGAGTPYREACRPCRGGGSRARYCCRCCTRCCCGGRSL